MHTRLIQTIIENTRASLSIADARGTVRLFNSFFKTKKGYPQFVNHKNWREYKHQIYKDYHRCIRYTYPMELRLIRKYCSPVAFLRHKCKNIHKMTLHNLTQEELEYYAEIGGVSDVAELFKKNKDKIDGKLKSLLTKIEQKQDYPRDLFQMTEMKLFKQRDTYAPMDPTLCRALTLEKPICAFVEHPTPSFTSFLDWLQTNFHLLSTSTTDKLTLIEELNRLMLDDEEWKAFIFKWKLWMIFLEHKNQDIWTELCIHFNIPIFS